MRIGFWRCQVRVSVETGEAYRGVVVLDGVYGVPWEAVCLDGVDCGHGVAASMLREYSEYSIIE